MTTPLLGLQVQNSSTTQTSSQEEPCCRGRCYNVARLLAGWAMISGGGFVASPSEGEFNPLTSLIGAGITLSGVLLSWKDSANDSRLATIRKLAGSALGLGTFVGTISATIVYGTAVGIPVAIAGGAASVVLLGPETLVAIYRG